MEWLLDIVLPSSDTVVLIQTLVVLVLWVVAVWWVRSYPPRRLLAIGSGLVVLGLMGVRALH